MKLEELDLERYAQDPQSGPEIIYLQPHGNRHEFSRMIEDECWVDASLDGVTWCEDTADPHGEDIAYVRADLAPEVFGMLRRSRVDPEELWKAIEKMLSLARSLEFKEKLERDLNQGYPATKELRDLREENYQQRVRVRKMVEDL